jgi:hypothetical protein
MDLARPRLRAAVLAASLLVMLAPLAAPAPVAAAPAADGDTYMGVVDLTFPVDPAKVHFTDTYDAARTGHVHQATDIMGTKLLPIYAAVGGVVSKLQATDDAYGYRLTIAGDDGRSYSYIHLNNDNPGTDDGQGSPAQAYAPGVTLGGRVERGQHIAFMGDSGNAEATAPHLHFSITDPAITDPYGTHIRNPYPSLVAAQDEGDVPTEAATAPPAGDPPPPLPPPPAIAGVCPTDDGQPTFSDVGSSNVHSAAVECLAGLDVTEGVGDGRYAPGGEVTRLQMASFTARLLRAGGVALPADPPDAFDDDAGTVHEQALNQLAALGVVQGTGESGRTFYGTTAMKRDRMAAWMARAYALIAGHPLPATTDDFFSDDGQYHEADINRLAAAGVVQGTGPGAYSPRIGVRRDQMASYLARTLAAAQS